MKTVKFPRIMFASAILLSLMVPLYAHHGTEFLTQAMESNTAEVQLAQLAEAHSQNAKVREFAKMMVMDHGKTLGEMQELFDARATAGAAKPNHTDGTHPKVALNEEHKALSARLSKLSGAEFDRQYMAEMVKAHHAAVALFEEQSHAHGANLATNGDKAEGNVHGAKTPDQTTDFSTDADTAAFASKTLPTIRMHLQHAETIQKELGGRLSQ